MALESGDFVNDLVITNPAATDNVSNGDDHLRLIKKVIKASFPSIDAAVNAIHTSSSAPSTSISAGLIWFDTTNNLIKLRNEANDAWITLPISVTTDNTVDINGGSIDGTAIGAASASTAVVSSLNVNSDGATVTGIKDEDDMSSDSAVKLATQQSIKAYVDSQVTAQDLDITTDSGSIDIDLDSETLTVSGGEGIDTSATGTTVTIAAEEATTSNKGVASFDTAKFTVSSGAVTTKDAAIIGAASLQDLSNVSSVSPTNDYVLKYSSTSSEWQPAAFAYPDKLTTKGDLLAYNTVDSETRFPISGASNGDVLTVDSSATNGFDWAAQTDTTYTAGDGLDLTGTAFSTDLKANGGLEIDSTELAVAQGISQYDVAQFATGVADDDFLRIDGTAVEGRSASEVLSDIAALPLAGGTMSGETIFADQLATRPEMKDYSETVNVIGGTGGGTQDIDLTAGNVVTATVDTSANTFTFSNPSASGKSCSFTLILTNGGSQTVNWPGTVDWAGGSAPTLTTSGVDVLTFFTVDAGTIWYGFPAGLEMG